MTWSAGQRETSAAMSPAASSTCSRLSSTSSMRRSPMTVRSASSAERPCASAMSSAAATVGNTSADAVTDASETNAAPPGYSRRHPAEQLDRETGLARAAVARDREHARAGAHARRRPTSSTFSRPSSGVVGYWRCLDDRRGVASRVLRTRRSSLATSSAVWKRARGSFSRQRATMRSRSAGTSARTLVSESACRAGSRS